MCGDVCARPGIRTLVRVHSVQLMSLDGGTLQSTLRWLHWSEHSSLHVTLRVYFTMVLVFEQSCVCPLCLSTGVRLCFVCWSCVSVRLLVRSLERCASGSPVPKEVLPRAL